MPGTLASSLGTVGGPVRCVAVIIHGNYLSFSGGCPGNTIEGALAVAVGGGIQSDATSAPRWAPRWRFPTLVFSTKSTAAVVLLAPYAAWVAFATYLNAGIWVLTR